MALREIRMVDNHNPAALKEALKLVRDVFWEFDAADYSDEGILEFSDYIEYDYIVSLLEKDEMVILGCYERNHLAGVLALRIPSHISLLFVAKKYQRRGVARSLMEATIRCIRQLSDAAELTVNSSLYAVGVYEKLGFTPMGPEQTLNGIRFIPMQRPLL